MLTRKDALKFFIIGNTGQPATLNLSPAISQALLEVSVSYRETSSTIYLEATV